MHNAGYRGIAALSLLLVGGSAAAQNKMEAGGSNYLAYYVIPSYLAGYRGTPPAAASNPEWLAWARLPYLPGAFQHVVADYHVHPEIVRSQLRQMYAKGQRKISLMMHLLRSISHCLDLANPPPNVCHTTHAYDGNDGSWGFAVPLDTVGGGLLPQHYRNLKRLLNDLQAIGYNQVSLRFAPFGDLSPLGWGDGSPTPWDDYHDVRYNVYWTALRSTIDSVNSWVPESDSLKVVYDLNVEIASYLRKLDGNVWGAGHSFGHVPEHTRRLWRDYLARYGNKRTIGFSFGNRILIPDAKGWQRESITVMNHDVYDVVGQRPSAYAFDIYPNSPGKFSGLANCRYPCYDAFFAEIARQIKGDPHRPQILVWESPYNDARFANAVRTANQRLKLGIPYVMQWASRDIPGAGHFTEPFPRDYSNYLKLIPATGRNWGSGER